MAKEICEVGLLSVQCKDRVVRCEGGRMDGIKRRRRTRSRLSGAVFLDVQKVGNSAQGASVAVWRGSHSEVRVGSYSRMYDFECVQ